MIDGAAGRTHALATRIGLRVVTDDASRHLLQSIDDALVPLPQPWRLVTMSERNPMFEQVMTAVDGSPTSNRGLKAAIGLAANQHASLTILHIVDDMASVSYVGDMSYVPASYVDDLLEQLRANGRRILAKAEAAARDSGVAARTLLVEAKGATVAEAILAQARRSRADVIVLGTHGRSGLRRVLMGSDAETVLRETRIPVLLVRSSEGSAAPKPSQPRSRTAGHQDAAAAPAKTKPRPRKRGQP